MLFVAFHICDVTPLWFTSDMNHKYNNAHADRQHRDQEEDRPKKIYLSSMKKI